MKTIFVSSTFKDMNYERDIIRDYVAPIINDKAQLHGDRVDFCDLRWGVNTEELDSDEGANKVLDVCFREIDRSNPPMIVILGERYGWIPDSTIVSNAVELRELQLEDLEKSVTALEIEYGTILKQKKTLVYFRQVMGDDIPSEYLVENNDSKKKLDELKNRIEKLTNSKIANYNIHINDGIPDAEDVKAFANIIINDLQSALEPEWIEYDQLSPFEREMRNYWNYVENKNKMFIARERDSDICDSLISSPDKSVIVCKGNTGSGKSTLLSHIASEYSKKDMEVLPLISGLTSQSNDAVDILINEIRFLELVLQSDSVDVSFDSEVSGEERIRFLRDRLHELLQQVAESGRNVLILVDALDQLFPDENRDNLIFLPDKIPNGIKFFLTSTNDFEMTYKPSHVLLPIKNDDKKNVIDGVCNRIGRELSSDVISNIIESDKADNPLYISLVVTRLLMMNARDFDLINSSDEDANVSISRRQIEILSESATDLERLSVDMFNEVANRINPTLCKQLLKYIASSRYGLRIEDLVSLSGKDWNQLDFSCFVNFLEDHFQIRSDGRYDFFHKCVRNGFRQFIRERNETEEINREISDYMENLNESDPIRKSEWIYHIISSNDKDKCILFMNKYVLSQDSSYAQIAASVCHDINITDNGQWFKDILEYAADKNEYMGTLWFVSNFLAEKYSINVTDLNIIVPILKVAEEIYCHYKERMSEKNKHLFAKEIYSKLALFSDSLDKHEDSYKYAELHLIEIKERYDWENNVEDRVALYLAYYNTIVLMKGYHNPDALRHTLEVAQEGLDMMDDEAWNLYMTGTHMLPYIDLMGEIYGSLGDRDKCLETYEIGLKNREEFYNNNPSKYSFFQLGGGYYNVAMTEFEYREDSHTLRAYKYIKKAISSVESFGDVVEFFETHNNNSLPSQQIFFCARVYHLARAISYVLLDRYAENIEYRENVLNWAHKAVDLSLYVYNLTGLPYEKDVYVGTHINFLDIASYSSVEEYERYSKYHKKWLEILTLRLYEKPSEERFKELYEIVLIVAESLNQSQFRGSRGIAADLIYHYGKKGLEAVFDGNKKELFRQWYKYCSDMVRNIINTGDESISESFVKDFYETYLYIYGNEDENDDEDKDKLFELNAIITAISNYYVRNNAVPNNDIKALMWLEKAVKNDEKLVSMSDNINWLHNLISVYGAIGNVAHGIDANNPIWRVYLNVAKEYIEKINYGDRLESENELYNRIDELMTTTDTTCNTPKNEGLIYALDTFRKDRSNKEKLLKLLIELLDKDIIIYTLKDEFANFDSDNISGWQLIIINNEKYLPVFTDVIAARKNEVTEGDISRFNLTIVPFNKVFELNKKEENFKGVYLNPQGGMAEFIPMSMLISTKEAIDEVGLGTQNNKHRQIVVDENMLHNAKMRIKYNQLLEGRHANEFIFEAIDSYAFNVNPNDILAIDEFGKKGLFRRRSEGIIFAREFICSSSFPEDKRIIYYSDISSLSQYADEARIKLNNGDVIEARFGDRTKLVIAVLNYIFYSQ